MMHSLKILTSQLDTFYFVILIWDDMQTYILRMCFVVKEYCAKKLQWLFYEKLQCFLILNPCWCFSSQVGSCFVSWLPCQVFQMIGGCSSKVKSSSWHCCITNKGPQSKTLNVCQPTTTRNILFWLEWDQLGLLLAAAREKVHLAELGGPSVWERQRTC